MSGEGSEPENAEEDLRHFIEVLRANYPKHLGRIVREDYLDPLGVEPGDLARRLGWSNEKLSEFLDGKRDLSQEDAVALAGAIGRSSGFLLRMQRSYHLERKSSHRSVNEQSQTAGGKRRGRDSNPRSA
jgi:antitoxin HigA-1